MDGKRSLRNTPYDLNESCATIDSNGIKWRGGVFGKYFRFLEELLNSQNLEKIRESFFLVPISPPVHFEGVENRNFFLDGRFCEQHLSERAVL